MQREEQVMQRERCETCGRLVAGDIDWAELEHHECEEDPCPHGAGLCWGSNCETESPAELRDQLESSREQALRLAALLHNVKHLLARVAAGDAPPRPHEQDRLDASRWLPDIERELELLPAPESRLIDQGRAVERYYPARR